MNLLHPIPTIRRASHPHEQRPLVTRTAVYFVGAGLLTALEKAPCRVATVTQLQATRIMVPVGWPNDTPVGPSAKKVAEEDVTATVHYRWRA